MKKLLLILFSVFCITSVYAQETLSYEIDEVATAKAPWKVGDKIIESEDCGMMGESKCYREFLGITKSGYFLVQEFYLSGKKNTDPMLTKSLDNAKTTYLMLVDRDVQVDGSFISWYENGNKEAEGNFLNGQPEGEFVLMFENGQKKMEFHYKNGERNGVARVWDKDGNLISEKDYGTPN